jgi:hypothetical protein
MLAAFVIGVVGLGLAIPGGVIAALRELESLS